jgi:hypothetical protein
MKSAIDRFYEGTRRIKDLYAAATGSRAGEFGDRNNLFTGSTTTV